MLPNLLVQAKLYSLSSMLIETFEISPIDINPLTINTSEFQVTLYIA